VIQLSRGSPDSVEKTNAREVTPDEMGIREEIVVMIR
jgi:hypothetical protein